MIICYKEIFKLKVYNFINFNNGDYINVYDVNFINFNSWDYNNGYDF